jgi:ABC-type antimicrobial peptide transport system permease subunit
VVEDVRGTRLDQEPVNMLYVPLWQRARPSGSILVRTAMNPASIASALRAAVWNVDRSVPVPKERTLAQMLSESVARRRFQMTLVLLFACAGLALAAFGTYGVVSYAVAQRRMEIGIRMSLGARSGNVLAMVLRQGMGPVMAGLAGGILVAAAVGNYLSSLLFQVNPHDTRVFAAASAVLIVVSALACWIPARRAAQVDPLEAMRYE